MPTRITRLASPFALLAAAAALAVAVTAPAQAAETNDGERLAGDTVSITQVDTSSFPTVRVAFGADDVDGQPPKLEFTENGKELQGVSVYRGELGRYEDRSNANVMIVLDTSLSMRDGRIEDAVAAAKELVSQANEGDRIGLATFGGDAKVVLKPTADHDSVRTALDEVPLANRTTMYDGVELAAQTLAKSDGSRRAIVLLSDGADTSSSANLDDAIGAALKGRAPVYSIAITAGKGTPKELSRIGNGTGGELRTVDGTEGLTAMFAELGRRILQPYWVEYRSQAPGRAQVHFGIIVGNGAKPDAVRSFRAVGVSGPEVTGNTYHAPEKATQAKPVVPIPDGPAGLVLVAAPFGALLFWLTWSYLRKRTTPNVLARIERYTRPPEVQVAARADNATLLRRLGRPVIALSESFLGHSRFFGKIRHRAEQAAIAVKPAELFGAMVGLGMLGAFFGLVIGGPLVAVIALVVLGCAPNIWLIMKARKRRRTFEDQLPDVLQGIASSLNAGHSFNQAINSMIKDAPMPTSEEFSRVMTEARLGMPIEEALGHMAKRMGSDDFDFAVTTVNIQRTVGGSLSEILEMVGDTVRNRQQFRKKVKALTSMGQMSAWVLLGMPVFLGMVLAVMSPAYMAPMFTTSTGHILLAIGAVSMVFGYVACMKIVKVKV